MSAELSDRRMSGGGWGAIGASLRAFFESALWERTIITLIVINAITLGLETSPTVVSHAGGFLRLADNIVLTIFVIEVSLRIAAYGRAFWRDGWSLFDFFIVAIALVPATGGFTVLRSLRIVRALRLISTIKSMRRVVNGMLSAIPSMGAVAALLALIFYVFSVMSTKLYGADYPDKFGTLGDSAFSLFQIMTLEGWADGFVEPVMEKFPNAWAFFIVFMLVTSFTVLNLFIGIIVDAMQAEQEEEASRDRVRSAANFDTILAELTALRAEVAQLRRDGLPANGQNPQARLDD